MILSRSLQVVQCFKMLRLRKEVKPEHLLDHEFGGLSFVCDRQSKLEEVILNR